MVVGGFRTVVTRYCRLAKYNLQFRTVSLSEAIHNSVASRRIFNSISGQVVVEQLTAFDPEILDKQITVEQSEFDPT